MKRRKIQFETLDSRNMLTSLTGDAVEVEDHRYTDGGIFTITVTVADGNAADTINGNRFDFPSDFVGWDNVKNEPVDPEAADVLFAETDESLAPG